VTFFKSQKTQDIETVRSKLDQARTELVDAEARLNSEALDAALSDNLAKARRLHEEVRIARERVEINELALAEAQRREDQRLAEMRAKEHASELRAVRQHISRLISAAQDFEEATAEQVVAFDRMHEIGNTILRLLPGDHRGEALRVVTHYSSLRKAGQVEIDRVGIAYPSGAGGRVDSTPGTSDPKPRLFQPLLEPKMTEELERRLLGAFAILSGKPLPTAPVAKPAGPARDPITNRFLPKAAALADTTPVPNMNVRDPEPLPAGRVHTDPEAQAAHDRIKVSMKATPVTPAEVAAVTATAEAPEQAPIGEPVETPVVPVREPAEVLATAVPPEAPEAPVARHAAPVSRMLEATPEKY
jgi:hypothetical protein